MQQGTPIKDMILCFWYRILDCILCMITDRLCKLWLISLSEDVSGFKEDRRERTELITHNFLQ